MTGTAKEQESLESASRLSFRVKVMYGVGEIANAIKVVTFALYSLFFATVVIGLPGTWIGAAAFFAMLWDASIDPYIGYLTDRAKSDSRKLAFMLTGALTMGAGYWAFFNPPHNWSRITLLAWLLAANFIVRTATSMYSIPYYAIGANLSEDYHERTSITAIRGITNIIGISFASSLSFLIFFPEKVPGVDSKFQRAGYASMGLTFGLVMTVVAFVAIWGTRPMLRRLAHSETRTQHSPGDFFKSMWESLRNRSFRVLLISFSLVVAGLAVNSSLLLHYLTYYVNVSGSVALSSSQIAFYSGGLLGTVFWLRVSKKFDKHRLYVMSAALTAMLAMAALPLFGKGHPLGTGDIRPWLIGYGIAGFFSSILWFIPQSMLADVADESELLTGRRREGALFGMFSFGQQVSAGIAVMLAGGLLDRFVRLTPGTVQQSASTVYRIGIVYSMVPAALFLAAAMLMLRYQLTRSRTLSIQAELRHRQSANWELRGSASKETNETGAMHGGGPTEIYNDCLRPS